jgi:hypothetical protein
VLLEEIDPHFIRQRKAMLSGLRFDMTSRQRTQHQHQQRVARLLEAGDSRLQLVQPLLACFTTLRLPMLFNLRSDPYERATESFEHGRWRVERAFALVPAQAGQTHWRAWAWTAAAT